MPDKHQEYMNEAIRMASENARSGKGGPFGALVVMQGEIIGKGVNLVTHSNDPTAHAEIMAIRNACRHLGQFSLEGAVIYSSCEPCPMCLSAIYWARISHIYYAAENTDAAKAGFDDSFIYKEIPLPLDKRAIPISQIQSKEAFMPFSDWLSMEDKITY